MAEELKKAVATLSDAALPREERIDAVRVLRQNWTDKIYEDIWPLIIAEMDEVVQKEMLRALHHNRGEKSLARMIRYHEGGKIYEEGVELIADYFSSHLIDKLEGEENRIDYVLEVMFKSLAREGSDISDLFLLVVKKFYEEAQVSTSASSLLQGLAQLFRSLMPKELSKEASSGFSRYFTTYRNEVFMIYLLTEITLPPLTHAQILLDRRSQFINAFKNMKQNLPRIRILYWSMVCDHETVRYNALMICKDAVPILYPHPPRTTSHWLYISELLKKRVLFKFYSQIVTDGMYLEYNSFSTTAIVDGDMIPMPTTLTRTRLEDPLYEIMRTSLPAFLVQMIPKLENEQVFDILLTIYRELFKPNTFPSSLYAFLIVLLSERLGDFELLARKIFNLVFDLLDTEVVEELKIYADRVRSLPNKGATSAMRVILLQSMGSHTGEFKGDYRINYPRLTAKLVAALAPHSQHSFAAYKIMEVNLEQAPSIINELQNVTIAPRLLNKMAKSSSRIVADFALSQKNLDRVSDDHNQDS